MSSQRNVVFAGSHYNDLAQDEPLAWTGRYLVPAALQL